MIVPSNPSVRKGLSGLRGRRGMGCTACGRPRGMGRLRKRLGQDDGGDWGDFGIDSSTASLFGGTSSLSPDLTSGLSLPGGVPSLTASPFSGGFPDTSSGVIEVLGPTSDTATAQEMGLSTAGLSNSQISSLVSSIAKGTAGVFGATTTPTSVVTSTGQAAGVSSLSSYLPLILLGGGGLLLVMALSHRRR